MAIRKSGQPAAAGLLFCHHRSTARQQHETTVNTQVLPKHCPLDEAAEEKDQRLMRCNAFCFFFFCLLIFCFFLFGACCSCIHSSLLHRTGARCVHICITSCWGSVVDAAAVCCVRMESKKKGKRSGSTATRRHAAVYPINQQRDDNILEHCSFRSCTVPF